MPGSETRGCPHDARKSLAFGAPGVDDNPQILVANAFKARAALKDPQYILNVGDNFYWGGIEKTCGEPMNKTFGLNLG